MKRIRIGTRGSALALWQAHHVRDRLVGLGHEVEVERITTTGDRLLDGRLESVGGKAAFLKEIEEALLEGQIDLAVHSLKDVPTELPAGLRLCAFLERADPLDAVVSRFGAGLAQLSAGARIGTTSLRRRAQLRALRPDLELLDLRGNVDTRLRRLHAGDFDAIVLAAAGLVRLGRTGEITERLPADALLPAPGQGAIALECREDDAPVSGAAAHLDHAPTARAVTAERALLAALGGGCNVPLGAFAEPDGAGLRLRAFVGREDGTSPVRGERVGDAPLPLGQALADEMIERGAAAILGR